ncbi:hypothetical protein GGR54DRAFT_654116 [Hypoxylon sp. NC1633]|nr:hypothetical protein GGR54DRAFT_654116 [Hypoxylon sp. NC1633]
MASSTETKFFEIPQEIFDMVIENIKTPRDYLHLAASCKSLWHKLNPEPKCAVWDAQLYREKVESLLPIQSNYYDTYYTTYLDWLRTWDWYRGGSILIFKRDSQMTPILRHSIETYLEIFPEAVLGSFIKSLRPLWFWAIQTDSLEVLRFLEEKGLAPPLSSPLRDSGGDTGIDCMDVALECKAYRVAFALATDEHWAMMKTLYKGGFIRDNAELHDSPDWVAHLRSWENEPKTRCQSQYGPERDLPSYAERDRAASIFFTPLSDEDAASLKSGSVTVSNASYANAAMLEKTTTLRSIGRPVVQL